MTRQADIDPIWEEKYNAGHMERYPWDSIVSFVFRNAPRDRPRGDVAVLEVGCGTASNIWFLAREGFRAYGIDASPSAIAAGRKRMAEESLEACLEVASFAELPFADGMFDIALDRGALTCAGRDVVRKAIGELRRTLKPGGLFFFNPYSADHGSRLSGHEGADGLVHDISKGSLRGCGHISFYSHEDAKDVLGDGFTILSCRHVVDADVNGPAENTNAEWRIIARRD